MGRDGANVDSGRSARGLGDVLVTRGVLAPQALADAVRARHSDGIPLDRRLLASGAVTRRELLSALEGAWGAPAVDLMADPPDPRLVTSIPRDVMLRERWVPHHEDPGGTMVVATAEVPDTALTARVRGQLLAAGRVVRTIEFVATTDWDVSQALLGALPSDLVEQAAGALAAARPDLSADRGWVPWQRNSVVVAFVVLAIALLVSVPTTLLFLLIAVNVMFFVGVTFKIVTCTVGMRRVARIEREQARTDRERETRIPDAELPRYTILVPVYHEAEVLPHVVEHLGALDYPSDKLQVLVLLELDDTDTIAAAQELDAPPSVQFVVIPPGGPQTKPKACNVGLALAEGKYLVIFDAEDRPEPGQLREIVARFAEEDPDVACIQARLNYFNADENILTRCFTLEYSLWFDEMLPGLDSWHLPIPLGGTSNHFSTAALRYVRGWDPYNVTEDADLGLRAAAHGLRVGIADSTTWEEACSQWRPWIRQRTRWIKGYMVTALVHSRRPRHFWREGGWRGVLGLVGLVMGTPAMFLAAPVLWGLFLWSFLGGSMGWLTMPHWAKEAAFANLVLGNGAMIILSALAARRRKAYDLIPFALLNPAYWILHSIAAWRALFQLVRSPGHWEKTPHGLRHGPDASPARDAEPQPAVVTSGSPST